MKLRRRPLPATVNQRISQLLAAAATARSNEEASAAWAFLEDAHVLSQPWVRPHVRVHLAMLSLGWRERDRREILGQSFRLLVAGPGSALGRFPTGNTGRSQVSAFEPMPVRPDLAELLDAETGIEDGVLDADGVRALYDRVARIYDIAAAPYGPLGGRRLAERAIEELGLVQGDTVVDLGTGTGWNLPKLAAAVGPNGRVIGVDISPRMLDRARHRLARNEIENVELVEHDIATYQPPPGLDAVISTFAIEMLPDYDEVLGRYTDALALGGRIATTGLRHPERWPEWLIVAGTAFMRIFGVSDAYRTHRPWEAIRANTDDFEYEERFAGANYVAAGSHPDR